MHPQQSLIQGSLQESLDQLQEQVRKDPANPKHRVFLFQLLAVLGDWNRAMTQLNVLGEMDASTIPMVQAYREALKCEVLRVEVFAGQRAPLVFGEPERWVALLMEALRLTAQGQHAQSQKLRDEAFEAAPTTSGTIDDQAFEWIADADARLGPVLEAIVNGRYYWVPIHRIRQIDVEAPADLRDLVWMPAHFLWVNSGETVGLIPTRYVGSEASDDPQIRMARKTEWIQQHEDVYLGLGQRMLSTDADEYPLMNIRAIRFNVSDEEAATT